MDYIQGSTKSPSHAIYKDFQKAWPEILERANNIDQLLFFNYDREEYMAGTEFHRRVLDTKNFCSTGLKRGCFQRGDIRYKVLCELIFIYPGFQFK